MGRPDKLLDKHYELATQMARTGASLKQAATELGIEITNEEAVLLMRRSAFNRVLWEARHRYFNELAKDPNFSRDTVVGKLIVQCQKLEEEGDWAKASDVLYKISKILGFVGPESQVSVFGELSQADLDAIRQNIESGAVPIKPN